MATVSRNPWDTDPVAPTNAPWASDPVVTSAKNPWDNDPVAAPAARTQPQANPEANVKKFLDFLGRAEGADYNTIVGGKQFTDFGAHPRVVGLRTAEGPSTAAGKYQIVGTTYDAVAPKLGIRDFSPDSQDKIAVELIRQKGALEDVRNGNFDAAVGKLGGTWASLPSSPYSQPKRSAEWVAKELGSPTNTQYQSFANVRKNIDEKSLNVDPDWLKASALLYELWERKPYAGKSQDDLAEWGKDRLGYFNYNNVDMARIAYAVTKGSQEQKEAFLFMLDTYDETNHSWAGAGRAAKGVFTDVTNVVGLGTLGIGFGAKLAARNAAKAAAREIVKRSMVEAVKDAVVTGAVRTGVIAGMEGAVYAGAQSAIKQGVEVSAGRREEVSGLKLAGDSAIGAVAGLTVGTGLDVVSSSALPPAARAVNKIREMFRGTPKEAPTVTPPGGAVDETGRVRIEPTLDPAPTAAAIPPGATPETVLTPDEILAAQARQQDGRLPADEVAPDMSGRTDGDPLITVPEVENTGMRTTRVNGEPVAKVTKADAQVQGATIVQQLRDSPDDELPFALEELRRGSYNREQQRVVDLALMDYNGEVRREAVSAVKERDALLGIKDRTPEQEARLNEVTARADYLAQRSAAPGLADDAAGSMAGTMLSDRRNGGAGTSTITVESIMAEKGIPREEALTVWAEAIAKVDQDAAVQKVAAGYEAQIAAAREAGDDQEVARLAVRKGRELASMGEQITPGAAGFAEKLKELAISNVFTPTTVQVNFVASAVKTMITPSLRFVFGNDYSKAARSELAGSYAAMRSSFGSAVAQARTGYRLEQALLTRDSTRLVDGELALSDTSKAFKWLPAGAIRFLPRVLNASDEFLSRLAYDSYVGGKAAFDAALEGAEKGLKGKALDDFIEQASEKALTDARQVTKGEDVVQPIVNKGVNKGLTGDELWDWVEKEAMLNPDALKKGTDEGGLAYVRDLLYKRDFSGEGKASKLAQLYEKGAKAVPSWALITGQLFFRTPIRVFEEGVRLTPGLQLIAPNFLADLGGKNGTARQVRAQAESMTSLAVAGAVLSLYSQGLITGDGAYSDFKQGKNRTDGPLQAPYTIKMSDGSTWSYKLFDPLSTPVKIMVNALERADKLRLKQSQGEDIPDSKIEEAYSHVSVGVAAILTAIKDANLVTGARMTAEIFTNAQDIEKNESKFLKLLGEKMFLLVPNSLHKIAKDHDPELRDPVDFWQMVEDKLARPLGLSEDSGIVTSKSYDILGNVRRPADTGTLWNIFSTASLEERSKGLSEKEQVVMTEVDRLARVANVTFKPPIKHPMLGDLDLRTVVAKDGKRTLYDVWQENYKALKPEETLYELAKSDLPTGTFKERGVKAQAMQAQIDQFQKAAFAQLLDAERDTIETQIDKVLRKRAESKAGLFDSKLPY